MCSTAYLILFVVQLEGDLHFLIGISRSVKMMLETLELPLYYYRFSIDTKLNMLKKYLPVSLPGK